MPKGVIVDEMSATFSEDRVYRYRLSRTDNMLGDGTCLFIMLNPSTADENLNDPTVTRCIGFARQWGYKNLEVVNIFALRSTDPRALKSHPDPVGPGNDKFILSAVEESDRIVFAWGALGAYMNRGKDVIRLVTSLTPALCFGLTNEGQPRHPLYLKKDAGLIELKVT